MRNLLARHFENLLHLKAITDAGSFNRAAKMIGLSQPALTRSIHRLEAAVGAPLLTRVAKGVYPTECGRALLDHIDVIDAELEQATTMLRVMKGRAGSQLACGGSFVPMCFLIPRAIKDFSEGKPSLHVRLVENSTDNLLRMLRLGELELVVCAKMGTGCIAFSTSLLVAQDLLDGTTREVQGDWRFPTTSIAVFHRDQTLSAAALFFLECLRRVAQSLSTQDATTMQDAQGPSYAQH